MKDTSIFDVAKVNQGIEAACNAFELIGLNLYETFYVCAVLKVSAEQKMCANAEKAKRDAIIEAVNEPIAKALAEKDASEDD